MFICITINYLVGCRIFMEYLNNYLSWHAFLFMLQEVNEISRISRLFTEITTINLSVTQKQIQNRKVEFI